MKKVVLLSLCIFIYQYTFSQNNNLNSAVSYYDGFTSFNVSVSLVKAKEKIDLAAVNEKTRDKYKTWYYKGRIYLSLFDVAFNDEMKKSTEKDSIKKILLVYQNISPDHLDTALQAFQKEIQLDDKKIYTADAISKIKLIAGNYDNKGYSFASDNHYKESIASYEKAYTINKSVDITDTVAVINIANSSAQLKDYKKAEEYYGKLIDLKFKPDHCYLTIAQMYSDAGDTAAVRRTIERGLAAIPGNYALLVEQINLYLRAGKSTAAINGLKQALSKSPNNAELHLVLGQTYHKLAFPKNTAGKDLPKPTNYSELVKLTEEEFSKAVALKPDYFIGLYSLGVFYNNVGAEILNQAEKIKDPKKAKVEEAKVDGIFQKAIPLLEKAHQLDPTDSDTMYSLRQLYARTGQTDTEKYRKLNEEMKK